jgi:D-sedoheptulose 7-phosphate isomerase
VSTIATTSLDRHLDELLPALDELRSQLVAVQEWGCLLAGVLRRGGRLLAAGNGGSAAHAQHLTAELVGRYRADRRPFSAISLHAEPSALTAIVNDYGPEQAFARQVLAHGRPDDILIALSTSGHSPNVLAAVDAAAGAGLQTWAVTGPAPNPLAARADRFLAVESASTPTVQEVHQVVVHLVCEVFDAEVERLDRLHGGPR